MRRIDPKVLAGRVFWRVHWSNLPAFTPANAWSRPWGEDGDPVRGYSAMESAEELVRYFNARSGVADDAPIVVFTGVVIGTGPDNEPLVIPSQVLAWVTGADLDRGILENEDDPNALADVLMRVGGARRRRRR